MGRLRVHVSVALAVAALTASGCASEATSGPTTTVAALVTPAEAIAAIARWEVAEQEPRVDDDGEPILPVIYFTAIAGDTIDIGVQADVVEATADIAVVRFSDTSAESLDEGLDGVPVRDDGVMFVVDELPDDSATVETSVSRYRTADDDTDLLMRIRATDGGAEVIEVVDTTD